MLSFKKYAKIRESQEIENDFVELEEELRTIIEVKKWKDKDTNPSKDTTKKERSTLVKRIKRGEDVFGGGKNFKKIAAKAAKRYGSKERGERVAAAVMWKKLGKKGMTAEQLSADDLLYIFDEDLNELLKARR